MQSSVQSGIETVQAYWNARPCNVRHSSQPVGTKAYFDEVERRKYLVEPHIPGFAQFERWKGKKVLEVGCGIGTDTINFARAGATVTAVDLSEKSLEIARERAKIYDLQNAITFYHANAEELSLSVPVKAYDLVYSFGVLHHTPNPRAAFAQIKRFMNHLSELRVMLYAKISWKNIMIEAGLDQPEAQSGCPIALTFTQSDIRDILEGYSITEIRQDHIFPFVVEKYVNYEYEVAPWFAAMPKEMFNALEKTLGWHMLITARLT